MTRTQIFVIFVVVDLVIVGACVWSVFHRIPARQFLVPAIIMFTLSGLWLLWMTLRHTPPQNPGQ
ncbi:MAG TPA: hypothetical protein VJA94_19170 [Candidatus Angelobacter sp.]